MFAFLQIIMNNTTVSNVSNTSETVNQFQLYSPMELILIAAPQVIWIDRLVTPIWFVIGYLGNPVSAAIWLSRQVQRKLIKWPFRFKSLLLIVIFKYQFWKMIDIKRKAPPLYGNLMYWSYCVNFANIKVLFTTTVVFLSFFTLLLLLSYQITQVHN